MIASWRYAALLSDSRRVTSISAFVIGACAGHNWVYSDKAGGGHSWNPYAAMMY